MDEKFAQVEALPEVRRVDSSYPWRWLLLGWQDLMSHPVASLSYGVFYAFLGYLVLAFAHDRAYLFIVAVSGFFFVGPIAAAGLYELSRRRQAGERCGLLASIRGLKRCIRPLGFYCAILAVMFILWERLSVILFQMFYQGSMPTLTDVVHDFIVSDLHSTSAITYLVIGGSLAALVFILSAVSVPMIVDRGVDVLTAMMTSVRAVGSNLGPGLLWAAIIVGATVLGFVTFMFGVVVLFPLIGHASWHAYRDLVEAKAP